MSGENNDCSDKKFAYTEEPPEIKEQDTVLPPWGWTLRYPVEIIDGEKFCIGLWKGFLPEGIYYGEHPAAGGVGAEVALYKPRSGFALLNPAHDQKRDIKWELRWKHNGEVLLEAPEKHCWWRHKWITHDSWDKYKHCYGVRGDFSNAEETFELHYWISGHHRKW